MEKEKKFVDQVNNYKISRNKYYLFFLYILVQFLLASVVTIGFALVVAKNKGLDNQIMLNCLSKYQTEPFDKSYLDINYNAQAFGNFFSYVVVLLFIIILCKNVFVDDALKIKNNKKFNFYFIILSTAIFALVSLFVDKVIQIYVPVSNNQSTIVTILSNGGYGMVLMTISVLLAPIVEEFIYRHCIFHFLKKYNVIFSYAVSIILFVFPHMLSTKIENVGIWLLQSLPYVISAFMLALIYHKSNRNIYASISAHMLNNIIAVIEVFYFINK